MDDAATDDDLTRTDPEAESSTDCLTSEYVTDKLSLPSSSYSSETWLTSSWYERLSASECSKDASVSYEPHSTPYNLSSPVRSCVVNMITLYDSSLPAFATKTYSPRKARRRFDCNSTCTVDSCTCASLASDVYTKVGKRSSWSFSSRDSSTDAYPSSAESSLFSASTMVTQDADYKLPCLVSRSSTVPSSGRASAKARRSKRAATCVPHWMFVKRKILRMLNVPKFINFNIRKNNFQQEVC
ncbi:hypothetical protein RR48_13868 [Papilio machaon]|uniref:Uncharacterized protein n=1 Tax=Papilio machaon TaxID=76193 RepID=A0A194RHG2_PAPMA|nr:hypothetical protein RR48_13868 [Papilio machaon]